MERTWAHDCNLAVSVATTNDDASMRAGDFTVRSLGRRSVATVARTLARANGLTVLSGSFEDHWGSTFVGAFPDAQSREIAPPLERATDRRGLNGAAPPPLWVGQIPYEALRDIERSSIDDRAPTNMSEPCWKRYPAMIRIDAKSGSASIEGTREGVDRLGCALLEGIGISSGNFTLSSNNDPEGEAQHLRAIEHALSLIAQGDTYQVNLARQLRFAFSGDPLEAFLALRQLSPGAYHFFGSSDANAICANSPELALARVESQLVTRPMKGTRARGQSAIDDAAIRAELETEPKELAELTMAVDLHRNDLGRVAAPGSVSLKGPFQIHRSPTVWSRFAEVSATLRDNVTLTALFRAVLPCGSVTGAPKVRAMQVIASLEAHRRGLYTGAYGALSADGRRVVLAVAIRTLVVNGSAATYGSGGGIVADSKPLRELDETRWKASAIQNLASSIEER